MTRQPVWLARHLGLPAVGANARGSGRGFEVAGGFVRGVVLEQQVSTPAPPVVDLRRVIEVVDVGAAHQFAVAQGKQRREVARHLPFYCGLQVGGDAQRTVGCRRR
ncbi:hypothetical protein D3C76_1293350 [compost metagenome]